MKTIIALLLSTVVNAATYTVKTSGGDYATIQACATAISAGDTCTVYAGTYAEDVTLTAGGSGAYKTLQINGTDEVYVLSFTVASYNRIIGFRIQNPASPDTKNCITVGTNATDVYITGNRMYACGYHAMIRESITGKATYVRIQGNTFSYPNSTSSAPDTGVAMSISGDYHLIENNTI